MAGRTLSRNETHDLGMILKDRAKVLKAHVEHQAALVMADFEQKIAAIYSFNQDDIWKKAMAAATEAVQRANEEVSRRCKEMGIPDSFAPYIGVGWVGRGENAVKSRQDELRRVAKTRIDAMSKEALLKIERQSLDLRTQVVALGLLSDEAKLFLESLAPVEEAMSMLEFAEVEKQLEIKRADRKRLGYDP